MNQEYTQKIEKEFSKIESDHAIRSKKKATGIVEVLRFLFDHPERIWWWSWELNGKTNSRGDFLSHRACARASDLALHHSELVEDRRIGRFKVYRAKLENLQKIKDFLNE